jgi:outer membrane immunogenic protein
MKSKKKAVLLCAALLGTGVVHAQSSPDQHLGDFSGFYAGAKAGVNFSSASGAMEKPSHTTFFPGLAAGYGFNVGPVVLGAEAFMDFHHGSATLKDGGVDAKLGYPIGRFMPYARMGVTTDWPGCGFHYGAGLEYQLTKHVSVFSEWTGDSANSKDTHWLNNSITVGVAYRFK